MVPTSAGQLSPWRVGTLMLTAISDGFVNIDSALLPKSTPEEVTPLLAAAGLPEGQVRVSINAFVIDLPQMRVLVDAGLGAGLSNTAGALQHNLKAAGVSPESVDVILLTHLHRDHVRGVTSDDGRAVFPKAEIMLHESDLAFWTDEGEESRAPDFAKQYFPIARAALKPYAGRLTPFGRSGEVLPGIEAIHAPGHTPGHTMYRLRSGDDTLLIAADIVHMPALQLPRPDWSIILDVDPEQAAKTRVRVLEEATSDRELVTGMHFADGHVGRFSQDGRGYRFEVEPDIRARS